MLVLPATGDVLFLPPLCVRNQAVWLNIRSKQKQYVASVVNPGHNRGMIVDDPKAQGGIPVTDGMRGMGCPAYRMAYRTWSRTVRVLREPSGRFHTGFFA